MLEILTLIFLGKQISAIVSEKGKKPFPYVLLMIVLWIGFEIGGLILGMIMFEDGVIPYLIGIAGAAFGGFLSYSIAQNVKPEKYEDDTILDNM